MQIKSVQEKKERMRLKRKEKNAQTLRTLKAKRQQESELEQGPSSVDFSIEVVVSDSFGVKQYNHDQNEHETKEFD
eukprot:CAMPEP_0116934212 /NCGR_PEP_ID=MMETSP0467-20121206/29505_1 /TAXON_ID=283647 /ORGANISM="Mesodinium pulex, Strain SPMC105" /LENGTH=75 /DNA_ID=CAMNT_0004615255 /DNA_START=143 /DNA_END=370 /DNA_ORIENTATION=+